MKIQSDQYKEGKDQVKVEVDQYSENTSTSNFKSDRYKEGKDQVKVDSDHLPCQSIVVIIFVTVIEIKTHCLRCWSQRIVYQCHQQIQAETIEGGGSFCGNTIIEMMKMKQRWLK